MAEFTNTFTGTSASGKKNSYKYPEGYKFKSLSFNQNNAFVVLYGWYDGQEVTTNILFAQGVTQADTTITTILELIRK